MTTPQNVYARRQTGLFGGVFQVTLLLSFAALAGADDKKPAPAAQPEPTKPALPTEFAFTLSKPYGQADRFTRDPVAFENLLINMKKSGFNTIHCYHRDWRLELCRKHGIKMMLDVLCWEGDCNTDYRRPEQRVNLKPLMEKLRNDQAVWGYNIWNETLSWWSTTDKTSLDDCVSMMKEWDPTHPIWLGTYRVNYANGPKSKPGVHGYYTYPWERGFNWHFATLNWYRNHVPSQDGVFGSWEVVSNYNHNSYSVNTNIAFGSKVVIWFIDGPFDEKGNVLPKDRSFHYVRIGQEMHKLYPEIGKIGRPTHVFSTPTTKWQNGKDKPADVPKKPTDKPNNVPWGLAAFPPEFWFQVTGGEAVVGFFKYPDGADAVWIANHNAFGPQQMAFTVAGSPAKVEQLDRESGEWKALSPQDGAYRFDLRAAGGELVRVTGRK